MDDSAFGTAESRAAGTEPVFRAMAEPTRRRLLQVLTLEELKVSELVEVLGQPQSTLSRHLRVLREAGLVRDRREGASSLYVASSRHADDGTGDDDLSGLLLGWLKRNPLPTALAERLRGVVARRRSDGVGFFNRIGRKWEELRRGAFGESFAFEAFLSLLPRAWRVVDIGAGTGEILPALASHFDHVVAVEPAEAMLACARQRVASRVSPEVSFCQGSLSPLPLADGSADLAIAMLVIHHLRHPEAALAELHRVLRPGGRVLLVEQEAHENQDFYERMQDFWWGFAPGDLSERLRRVGFRHVRPWRLTTTREAPGAADAPPLFALTGERADSGGSVQ